MSFKGSETVELRRVETDRFGDETPSDTLVTFTKCAVIPRILGEENDRGSIAIPGFQVAIPPQSLQWDASVAAGEREILDTDQVKVRGDWLNIDGKVAVYVDLKGKHKATMVTTKGAGE